MNKKIFAFVVASVAMFVLMAVTNAQPPAEITIWTDRNKYAPGEKGTLYIAFYNQLDVAVSIKNITITYYSWTANIGDKWVGNETRKNLNIPISGKGTHVFNDITFTVPTDGRAVSTSVYVEIGTDHGMKYDTYYSINVPDTPRYMEQIVTIFTIQVVLIIVCTIIVAATIFLSARRPRVTWSAEEKPE